MKKIFSLIAIAFILFSCKKEEDDPKPTGKVFCVDSLFNVVPCPQ